MLKVDLLIEILSKAVKMKTRRTHLFSSSPSAHQANRASVPSAPGEAVRASEP